MSALIDQQRNDEDFMYCIDPLRYYYISEEDPHKTISYLLQKGLITMSEVVRIMSNRKISRS